jgi:hypothetical protein
MNDRVTTADLARILDVGERAVRGKLRDLGRAGDQIVRAHRHGQPWTFTAAEAEAVVAKLRPGTREAAAANSAIAAAPQTGNATAHDVALALTARTPRPAGDVDRSELPRQAGLYAWWAEPETLTNIVHRPAGPTTNRGRELLYIGIAQSLRERIGNHLGRHTGKSTLRRVLGAWLGDSLGWTTELRAGRLQHTPASERLLTDWMKRNLSLTWVAHVDPAVVEPKVIDVLGPPLNYDHNSNHPNWQRVANRRKQWRDGPT